jgi:hypothetical protein
VASDYSELILGKLVLHSHSLQALKFVHEQWFFSFNCQWCTAARPRGKQRPVLQLNWVDPAHYKWPNKNTNKILQLQQTFWPCYSPIQLLTFEQTLYIFSLAFQRILTSLNLILVAQDMIFLVKAANAENIMRKTNKCKNKINCKNTLKHKNK